MIQLKEKKDISHYLTLRTKTTAEYYFEAESREDWLEAVDLAKKKNIPLFVLGGGSNLAVLHDQIDGLVVRNLYRHKEIITETDQYVDLKVSSGYPMARLVIETTNAGYSGFEWHLGLPGTIGGAIAMNSKWTYKQLTYIGDNLISATLLDKQGTIKEVDHDYFNFAYDYSILKDTKEIVLEAVFRLKKDDPQKLKELSLQSQEYRKHTQVHGAPTAGCFFQNISEEEKHRIGVHTQSAGNLIDKAGLKGTNIGGFEVSQSHANFIINKGEGRAQDLVQLLALVKTKVKEKFDIDLKEEVIII